MADLFWSKIKNLSVQILLFILLRFSLEVPLYYLKISYLILIYIFVNVLFKISCELKNIIYIKKINFQILEQFLHAVLD